MIDYYLPIPDYDAESLPLYSMVLKLACVYGFLSGGTEFEQFGAESESRSNYSESPAPGRRAAAHAAPAAPPAGGGDSDWLLAWSLLRGYLRSGSATSQQTLRDSQQVA